MIFLGVIIFLSFNRHSKAAEYTLQSELWSDKSGYYVYLPATFKYSFNPEKFPPGIDTLTGKGFLLDYQNGKVLNKYTSGIAILQLPFYLIADGLAEPLGFEPDGFSWIYRKSINIGAAIYLLLGLICLIKFLLFRHSLAVSIITAFCIFSVTNLFYYTVDETAMTHMYSFTLFAIFLYFIRKTSYFRQTRFWQLLFLGAIAGLIVVIRPTNALFFSVIFFLDVHERNDILERLKTVFRQAIPLFLGALLALTPQMLYWYHTYDTPLYYSYTHEGFDFTHPELIKFWFSPRSGVFTYTPLYFVLLASLVLMIRRKAENGVFILAAFFVLCFVFSCWWDWGYGCSFGSRNLVEYLALFSIPLAGFVEKVMEHKRLIYASLLTFAVLLAMNMKIFYSFDDCFYGEDWEWGIYYRYLFGPTL